ncbi:MAG: trans-splicing intein-formed DNA polymerase III subunit alpha C-terminal partner DnaE-C [Leptolyngbya sp. RL_3_1]|nr:trans-splicing intein-formed DNA polymerase III subunit alpha C-terminal partner DnaE-C [Leptolyngbya sp. RL_3_1]
MVKIVSRQSLGIQPVYDIGVERDHNFLLANGLVASNCFNKSHSTAYGFVTFQTAYLKAHYPVEYMAALLTANSGDQDKVQSYIANCIAMGIEVLPPDVNKSLVDFTPEGKRILFGLGAVRNVGQGAIECLIASRTEEGPFQSLADLCDRVDLHAVNRRALEALILSGAFDAFEPNRHQSMKDMELLIDWAQGRAKDRAIGQGNLLDMLGGGSSDAPPTSGHENAPKAPLVPDFDPQEKLRQEKELLGFYISDHPLKSVQKPARILAPINLGDLSDYRDKKGVVSLIALLSSVKPIITKKGDRMAIVGLEDLTGSVEGVVFPRSYERIGHHIVQDARLVIWGKPDRRDDQMQLIIEDAEPIEDVQLVMVELDAIAANKIEERQNLKQVIQRIQGENIDDAKVPIIAVIRDRHNKRTLVRMGKSFRVQDPDAAVDALVKANFKAQSKPLISA